MKKQLNEKIQEAKKIHLPAILDKKGYAVSFDGQYYRCYEFQNIRFKENGNGYFNMDVPSGAKGHVNDNIDFVLNYGIADVSTAGFESAVEWLIQEGRKITPEDVKKIPCINKELKPCSWKPPVPCGSNNKLYGFLTKQGMPKDKISKMIHKNRVFADTSGNVVFVVEDEEGNPIGHEIINWNYYRGPTGLDGALLDGYVPPTWEYGIDVKHIRPPER